MNEQAGVILYGLVLAFYVWMILRTELAAKRYVAARKLGFRSWTPAVRLGVRHVPRRWTVEHWERLNPLAEPAFRPEPSSASTAEADRAA